MSLDFGENILQVPLEQDMAPYLHDRRPHGLANGTVQIVETSSTVYVF